MRMISWFAVMWMGSGLVGCQSEDGLFPEPEPERLLSPPDAPVVERVDRRVQIVRPEVDVLFVVDDSCSMEQEQAALAANFDLFLDHFAGSGIDYHIGVTTTDTSGPGAGLLRSSTRGGGTHRFIDGDTPNAVAVFGDLIIAGTGGSPDERGRDAVYALLSDRLDHPANQDFYRDDASLHVIFVSDENDMSDSISTSEFLAFVQNLKDDPSDVQMHGVIGIPGNTCATVDTPGTLYRRYVNQTGGVLFDLCEPAWDGFLEDLGLQTSGLRREFFLSRTPDLDSPIDVSTASELNGQRVTRRFNTCLTDGPDCDLLYTRHRNSVVFQWEVPPPFAEVNVAYQIAEVAP